MITEHWIVKDVAGSKTDLILGIIPGIDWGKKKNLSEASLQAKIWIRVPLNVKKNATHMGETFV